MGKPPKVARSAKDMDVRLGGSLGGLSLGGGSNTTARRVLTRSAPRSSATPQPVVGFRNVVYYPPGDYITDTFEIDAPVAQVILNGAGTGPVDEYALGVLSTSHDTSAWVNPSPFLGGTAYSLIPIVRWVTTPDGSPIGSFTFLAAVDPLASTGTYSVNVQVAW